MGVEVLGKDMKGGDEKESEDVWVGVDIAGRTKTKMCHCSPTKNAA